MSNHMFVLPNLGNTCYINSIIQILLHTYELNHILQNTPSLKNTMESVIVKHWKELHNKTKVSRNISPNNLIYSIRKCINQFDNNYQQDASQFLIQLIDIFKIALSKPVKINISCKYINPENILYVECYKRIKELYSNEYSDLINIFNGMLITEIKDMNQTTISRMFDPYSILQLPTPNQPVSTIYHCLDLLWSPEKLTDYTITPENGPSIKNTVVSKTYYLWLTPKILILNLKKYNTQNKLNTYIDIPLELNLTKYLYNGCTDNPIYTLYAVCNHTGNLNYGHYYSYIFINQINKWVFFNDDSTPVVINDNQVSTKDAICVFYRKLG